MKYCHIISGNGNTISGINRAIHGSQIELKQDLCGALLCCHCGVTAETKAEQVEKGRGNNLKQKAKQNGAMQNQVDEFTRQKFKQLLLEVMLTFKQKPGQNMNKAYLRD